MRPLFSRPESFATFVLARGAPVGSGLILLPTAYVW